MSVSMDSAGSGVSGDDEEKDKDEELSHDDDEEDVDEINHTHLPTEVDGAPNSEEEYEEILCGNI